MKTLNTLLLISVVSLVTVSTVRAQPKEADQTLVVVVGDPQNEIIKMQAIEFFANTLRKTPQQVGMPKFMITDKSNKAVFTIGGFVNFRTAYDFDNVIGNIDFVTYNIPMSSTPSNAGRVLMDASTSRLYFKTLVRTANGNHIEAYVETDFRGSGNSLRLREAYISYAGLTVGQTVTTFCDLAASPNTIDFEGPNGYTYGRNLMIQYKHNWKSGWSAAIAAEYPVVSATVGSNAYIIPQRVPDIPAYVQYAWNKGQSHVRASGILRNMMYYDEVTSQTSDALGWGAQLSTAIQITPKLSATGQFLYGEGITPYIQDLAGNGLDLVANSHAAGGLITLPMSAWLVSAQYNVTPRIPITAGYSQVLVMNKDGYYKPSDYKLGQYVVVNAFYNLSQSLSFGIEYLYGTRTNQDGSFGKSNRIQVAAQFNF